MEDVTLYYHGKPICIDSNSGDDTEYVVHQDIYDALLLTLKNVPVYHQKVTMRRHHGF